MQTEGHFLKVFEKLLKASEQLRVKADSMAIRTGGYGEAILQTRQHIQEMQSLSVKMMQSKEREIFYFRDIWPVFYGNWFYYHKAHDFLMKGAMLSDEGVKALARSERREATRFFRDHWEFWRNYVGRTPNLNEQFLRSYSQTSIYDPMSLVVNPLAATVASYKAAWGLAFRDYERLLKGEAVPFEQTGEGLSDFSWNCSEVDAVEFLYSMFAEKVILYQGRPAEVVHLDRWFTLNFHKKIVNLYDRFKAARNRKKVRAPFMRRLLSGLERQMDQADGKFE